MFLPPPQPSLTIIQNGERWAVLCTVPKHKLDDDYRNQFYSVALSYTVPKHLPRLSCAGQIPSAFGATRVAVPCSQQPLQPSCLPQDERKDKPIGMQWQ